jgi:hypothetical protein
MLLEFPSSQLQPRKIGTEAAIELDCQQSIAFQRGNTSRKLKQNRKKVDSSTSACPIAWLKRFQSRLSRQKTGTEAAIKLDCR